jgi:hypothetical protein
VLISPLLQDFGFVLVSFDCLLIACKSQHGMRGVKFYLLISLLIRVSTWLFMLEYFVIIFWHVDECQT